MHPSVPGNCATSHRNLVTRIKKMEARQDSYNIRFICNITKRINVKGGDPAIILDARKNMWQGFTHTDAYLAVHSPVSGMELVPSIWDQQHTPDNTEKCKLTKSGNRQITTLINEALFESGDVETNPGPQQPQDTHIYELLFSVDS